MLCSEPAVPGQSLNASLCPPVLSFQATPEQGCQLGLALPGLHTQGCGDHIVLPAAQLELFLWEGDKSLLGGPTSCAATLPACRAAPAGKVRLMDQESLSLAVLP